MRIIQKLSVYNKKSVSKSSMIQLIIFIVVSTCVFASGPTTCYGPCASYETTTACDVTALCDCSGVWEESISWSCSCGNNDCSWYQWCKGNGSTTSRRISRSFSCSGNCQYDGKCYPTRCQHEPLDTQYDKVDAGCVCK